MTHVVMLCDYRLQPDRVGGADRFFWALQYRMLAAGWQATWLFPKESDYPHYAHHCFDIVLLPKSTFLEGATDYLRERRGVDMLVSVFTSYATRFPIEWKRLGVRRYLAVDQMSRPAAKRSLSKRARLALKGVLLYPFVTGIVAVSDFVRGAILRELGPYWSPKIRVIPNAVDTDLFYPSHGEPSGMLRPLHLVVVAHLIPEKGVQVLLQALHQAGDRLPGMKVSIAGDGPFAAELKAITSSLGLQDCVTFLGNIAWQDELLRSADIAVVPSLWQEGFGFTVIEAMASGVPVVASRIGGIPELLNGGSSGEQSGLLVPPGDTPALADALVKLANDPSMRLKLGQVGRSFALERYGLARMADGYFSLIKSMLPESA
ncbi:MAG: glycosyltransferase family 4 protein [Chloroflexia bacterium]